MISIGNLIIPTDAFVICAFVLQLALCTYAKKLLIRLAPIVLFVDASFVLGIIATTADIFDAINFLLLAIFALECTFSCGLAWAVWGIVQAINKKRRNTTHDDTSMDSEKRKPRKKALQIIQFVASIVLAIAAVSLLWHGLLIGIAGFGRENNAVVITDSNREHIDSLLRKDIALNKYRDYNYEEIPPISEAIEIEYLVLLHKNEITIHYSDGSTYRLFVTYPTTYLMDYIRAEGYNIYFNGPEFIEDLIQAATPLSFAVISIVVIIICSRKMQATPPQPKKQQGAPL